MNIYKITWSFSDESERKRYVKTKPGALNFIKHLVEASKTVQLVFNLEPKVEEVFVHE